MFMMIKKIIYKELMVIKWLLNTIISQTSDFD